MEQRVTLAASPAPFFPAGIAPEMVKVPQASSLASATHAKSVKQRVLKGERPSLLPPPFEPNCEAVMFGVVAAFLSS